MFDRLIYALRSLLKKPFKVGIITPQYPKKDDISNQGVAIHSYYLSEGLARLGCDVHIFTTGDKNSTNVELIGGGKRTIHKINIKLKVPIKDKTLKRRFSTFMFDNLILNEVFKEDAREKFDIIHSQITMTSALMLKYFNDAKWIHTFHSLERIRCKYVPKENKRYMGIINWMQSSVTYPDAIIAVSKSLRKEILNAHPNLKERKVFYIPNGVDTETFKPGDSQLRDKKVLFIARFSLEKGIDLVEKIAVKLLKRDSEVKVELVIPIDDYMSESMEKIKSQLETAEKTFPGRFIWHKEAVSREKLAEIYNSCLVYIQPSRYESFGMTVLEAMACGKAVVVSNRGGMPELVENAGRVVRLNTNVFVKEIINLLENYRLRERYSRRAIERAKQFRWEEISKRTLGVYKVITKEPEKDEEENIKEAMENLK
jgi:glycosyltransferase involved in cell wall biosynthesis